MKRLAAILAALLLAAGLITAPDANATPSIVWYVHYGSYATGISPNVWSNRVPTWSVGSDPSMTFDPNGNLRISGSFCPPQNAGICWSSHTANVGPAPSQAYWDSRPGSNQTGAFRIYTNDGVTRFETTPSVGFDDALMIFYSNACLDIYVSNNHVYWGYPTWANSTSNDCQIFH